MMDVVVVGWYAVDNKSPVNDGHTTVGKVLSVIVVIIHG